MPPSDTLGDLIAGTADGDEEALAGLYDATAASVHGLALRILGDRHAAEEVTGDVYLQVWRQAERYDPARGTPLGWLLTITRTRSIDRLRRQPGAVTPEPAETPRHVAVADDPEADAALAERRRLVQHALGRLAHGERRAIELAYFGGLSHTEIASATGAPIGTVKTRIRLGMMRLRQMLGGHARSLL
jgi:RNA polymerase sigma-70 factor (ECF subfamily)